MNLFTEIDDPLYGPPRFPLGEIKISKGVVRGARQGLLVGLFIDRHWRGDWGGDEESKQINHQNLHDKQGDVVSEFKTPFGSLWVRTEFDPEEDPFTVVCFEDEL